jgi:hypothetical protein
VLSSGENAVEEPRHGGKERSRHDGSAPACAFPIYRGGEHAVAPGGEQGSDSDGSRGRASPATAATKPTYPHLHKAPRRGTPTPRARTQARTGRCEGLGLCAAETPTSKQSSEMDSQVSKEQGASLLDSKQQGGADEQRRPRG